MKTNVNEGPPVMEAEDRGNAIVKITVNGDPVEIHRGSQTVATIKEKGGVPLAHELEQVIHGKLTPLADDGRVTIKGGEQFLSHVRDSGTS